VRDEEREKEEEEKAREGTGDLKNRKGGGEQ